MSASRSDPRAAGVLALALALAGCPTTEPEVRPFRLDVQVAGGGSLVDTVTSAGLITVSGVATVVDATTLAVAGTARGDLTLTFDAGAVPGLAFPARLTGREVLVEIFVDPEGKGPEGEPRRYDGYRVADLTTFSYDLALGEWTLASSRGVPLPPAAVTPVLGDEDLPPMEIAPEWSDWEPTDCGLLYYAPVQVLSPTATAALDRGDALELVVGAASGVPVRVHHVVTYHRAGSCGAKSRAWTQIAAWR